MNPMFLSFLNSMQTNSQNAQNPGLWVNGNRMPMQEQQGEPAPLDPPNEEDEIEDFKDRDQYGMSKSDHEESIRNPIPNKAYPAENPRLSTDRARELLTTQKTQEHNRMVDYTAKRKLDDAAIAAEHKKYFDGKKRDEELKNTDRFEIRDFGTFPQYSKNPNSGGLPGGRGAMQPEPMQEELARKLNPSSSSFFKPKSGRNNYLQLVAPPVDADGNREVTPEEAARSAALSAEIDASVRADRVRAQLQDQDKVVTNTRNPLEYAKDSTYDELDQRAAAIKRRRGQGLPVYSPDSAYEQDQNSAKAVVAGLQEENINHPIGLPLITFTNSVKKGFPNASVEERGKMVDDMMKAWNNRNKSKGDKPKSKSAPMQENTNRSMFLTHLQGMQTKSQEAQNPGLWVNGNRMPMHENTPGGGTPAGASPEEFAKARAANPFRVRLGKGRPAGAQDLNGDGLVSKAEQELIPVDLRDGDPSANHPDDTDYVHGDN